MGVSVFSSLLLLTFLTAVQGLIFPIACLIGYNGTRRPCCPSYNGSMCGSKDNRGSCMMLPDFRTVPDPDVNMDERWYFPRFFFNATCQCKPNFMGPACDECALGLTGDRCDKPNRIYRRSIKDLSLQEITTFLAELHYCKYKRDPQYYLMRAASRFHTGSYNFREASFYEILVFVHMYITEPFINKTQERSWINPAHGSTGFLSWHRLFLMLAERQMQKCLNNPSWALIYYPWEYDDPKECSICYNHLFGSSDLSGRIHPDSVFSSWRMVCGGLQYPGTVCMMEDCECERERLIRKVGLSNYVKSTLADVAACMDLPVDTYPWDSSATNSARNCFEGFRSGSGRSGTYMHNLFHMYFGGTMSQVPVSANDPVFFLHHCNMDKMFEQYIQYNGITPSDYPTDNNIYGHTAESCILPFLQCWKQKSMYITSAAYNVFYG